MILSVHEWQGECAGKDTLDFFDNYEDSVDVGSDLAHEIDQLCCSCAKQKDCLAFAVTHKEWGVWGGVYFEDGKISKRFNSHKTNDDWHRIWMHATQG